MKEIKAFVHRGRVADIVHALDHAGHRRLSVINLQGLLHALNPGEQRYSLELGERVTDEAKLEVICEDEQADEVMRLIQMHARTGQTTAGWVHATTVDRFELIGRRES